MEKSLLYILVIVSGVSALGVLWFNTLMKSALSLLVCMLALACVYGLCGAGFVALTQLILYVGGVMTLLLFAVFTTSATVVQSKWIDALCGVLLLLFIGLIFYSPTQLPQHNVSVSVLGEQLMTIGLVPFEWASVLLLMSIVGALYLFDLFPTKKSTR